MKSLLIFALVVERNKNYSSQIFWMESTDLSGLVALQLTWNAGLEVKSLLRAGLSRPKSPGTFHIWMIR